VIGSGWVSDGRDKRQLALCVRSNAQGVLADAHLLTRKASASCRRSRPEANAIRVKITQAQKVIESMLMRFFNELHGRFPRVREFHATCVKSTQETWKASSMPISSA
jgi:hypothetical protein